jgi:hypothetical protein
MKTIIKEPKLSVSDKLVRKYAKAYRASRLTILLIHYRKDVSLKKTLLNLDLFNYNKWLSELEAKPNKSFTIEIVTIKGVKSQTISKCIEEIEGTMKKILSNDKYFFDGAIKRLQKIIADIDNFPTSDVKEYMVGTPIKEDWEVKAWISMKNENNDNKKLLKNLAIALREFCLKKDGDKRNFFIK